MEQFTLADLENIRVVLVTELENAKLNEGPDGPLDFSHSPEGYVPPTVQEIALDIIGVTVGNVECVTRTRDRWTNHLKWVAESFGTKDDEYAKYRRALESLEKAVRVSKRSSGTDN